MVDGLILLVFIGCLLAVATVRGRRRLGLASTTKTWGVIIVGAVLIGLTLWAGAHP
jgi:hypothetical protein